MADAAPIPARTLAFPGGREAVVVDAAPMTAPRALVESLAVVPPKAVIVVIGSGNDFDSTLAARLLQLFARGLMRAAREGGAVIVDGGTDAGVMSVLGRAAGEREPRPTLVGVAPAGKVTYPGGPAVEGETAALEPNHSHFVLVDAADWGGETDTMFGLADQLAGPRVPVVTVVAGGGAVTRTELLEAVRRRWPVIVITGTGGLADDLGAVVEARRSGEAPQVDDPALAEALADGDFDLVGVTSDPAVLDETLRRRLRRDQSLELAWELYAGFNGEAAVQQRQFRRGQLRILALGVLATLLAVLEGTFDANDIGTDNPARTVVLKYAIIAVPILLGALVATAARFRPGSKWVVLRGSAEAIKREIFRYRARAGVYAPTSPTPRAVRLAERVGTISSAVMKTEVNLGALSPHRSELPPAHSVAAGDDGFSALTPAQYIEWRLQDQADWYRDKAVSHEKKMRWLRWAAIGFGGIGTFLAAIGFELWIAVTTAVAAAASTYLEYMQVERTLQHYNQASADLETIRRWWVALPPQDQLRADNVNRLVEQAERIMQSESTGWMQDMQDAMAELRRQQEKTEADLAANREQPAAPKPDSPAGEDAATATEQSTTGTEPAAAGAAPGPASAAPPATSDGAGKAGASVNQGNAADAPPEHNGDNATAPKAPHQP